MRLLVLSQWYSPEPDSRIHPLACGLRSQGYQVTSLTGFPNYPSGRVYSGYQLRWRQWEQRDGVRVLRVPLFPDHSRSGPKRILNYLSFALSASTIGTALCGSADVMWVYHPPLTVALPAWWISLIRRIPFVYEIQDMWPETLAATGMLQSGPVARILGWSARFIYARAAAIVVISPGFKRNLIAKGVPADKIYVIPNWADDDIYRPVPRDAALGEEFGLTDRFNVMFAGTMGAAQSLSNVLDAAKQLHEPAVQWVFIGDGIEADRLRQTAQAVGLSNVRFIGRQPAERIPHFLAWADALLVHLKRDPLFEITIPSKTIAYLACGRPIISCTAGDPAKVVHDAGAGLVCAPEDPMALAQAVRDLIAMPVERREALGRAGRQAFEANYTRAKLLARYEDLFQQIAGSEKCR